MLKLWQIVPYVILIILMYQIFEIRSTSDVMVFFLIFSRFLKLNWTNKHYKKVDSTWILTKNYPRGYFCQVLLLMDEAKYKHQSENPAQLATPS